MTTLDIRRAVLVLPRLRIQNANAISSPFTHGFPSITAFTGLMWALQRTLAERDVPLKLRKVGVVCHDHEEQVVDGYVKTFRLTRNPVDKDGDTAAIVEEGRIHLEVTLVFQVELPLDAEVGGAAAMASEQYQSWAQEVGGIVAGMRIAGGSVLPTRPAPGRRTRPWMETLPESDADAKEAFARWRRQWLPGYALVGRDDLLAARLALLRKTQPDATLLDAWLHAVRFNYEPVRTGEEASGPNAAMPGKVRWADPLRGKGTGWIVPIPVGYASLHGAPHPAGMVAHARDANVPVAFVESVYSLGEWISPHRLHSLSDLLWRVENDPGQGVYRCHSDYVPAGSDFAAEELPQFD